MKKDLKHYIEKSKESSSFDFIKDIKVQDTLYLFSAYIFLIYYEDILNKEVSEELKEIKAHTIFVYIGSIIESVIYYYVHSKLTDEKSKRKYLEIQWFKKLQKINETENLYICKLETKEITFNSSINFNALINWLKDKKLIDKKIIEKINYFRKMRNLVHVNAFLDFDEIELIKELEKIFLDTKEIFDYIESNILM